MRVVMTFLLAAALIGMAGLVPSASVTEWPWDAFGEGPWLWSEPGNWGTNFAYPDDTGDNVTFPYTNGGWEVTLITVEVGDMTIEASIDFYGHDAVLEVQDLVIDAGSGAIDLSFTDEGITFVANDN